MAIKPPWNNTKPRVDFREPEFSAEFIDEFKERRHTPWSSNQEEIVDYVGDHGGSIKKLFMRDQKGMYVGTAQGRMEISKVFGAPDLEELENQSPTPHWSAEDLVE